MGSMEASMSTPQSSGATAQARAEYLEMPGLALTVAQAARLWHLAPAESEQVLRELADGGLLMRDRRGAYRRRGCPRCC